MRKIKFRGKDDNDMWHYGFFWIAPDNTCWIKEKIDNFNYVDFKIIPETIGQYTELKKGRKEIYEGDILKYIMKYPFNSDLSWRNDYIGVVYYNVELGGWYLENKNKKFKIYENFTFQKATLEYFKIIGNIFDNPELMR